MPLYEYECEACGHRFEKIQKFSDPPTETCPKCGGAVRKLVSSPAFQFKGTGWYITDYAKKDQVAEGKGGKSSSAEGSDSSAPKDAPAAKESTGTSPKEASAKSDSGPAAASSSSAPSTPTKD